MAGPMTGMGGGVIIKPPPDVLHGFDVQTIGILSAVAVFFLSAVAIGKQLLAKAKNPLWYSAPAFPWLRSRLWYLELSSITSLKIFLVGFRGCGNLKQVNLLVKPASGRCNMHCSYCFYKDLADHRATGNRGCMSMETAEKMIRAAMSAAEPGAEVQFSFQGGEPTLVGLDFYRNFLGLVLRHVKPSVRVTYAIQTNGLAVDEEWVTFFRENHFLVGLSVDGTRELHNLYRKDAAGRDTWERIAQTAVLLQTKLVTFNLLCVVTRQCARSVRRAYADLKSLGCEYLQFIPCLDPVDADRGNMPFSLTPKEYGRFLCTLFDLWYSDWKRGEYVSIRLFDDYVHLMMGLSAGTCSTSGRCGNYLVVESDGSLYPCDFYALDQWRLGDVTQPLKTSLVSKSHQEFTAESAIKPVPCLTCKWMSLCNGGCKRDWHIENSRKVNYYCSSYRQFFSYAEDRLVEIARAELQFRAQLDCI